jgi:hypothetical protein
MTAKAATLGLLAAVALAGCAAAEAKLGATEDHATPIDRLIIGQASKYPADPTIAAKADLYASNMAERRKLAWSIVEKVLAPVRLESAVTSTDGGAALELPRFQTWYSREDILPMFDRLFRALPDADKKARTPFSNEAIDAVFPWNATMATTLPSFTAERLEARRSELTTPEGLHSLGKGGRVLMSPSYVKHVLGSYRNALACTAGSRNESCLDGEFPPDAVAIKARWMPSSMTVPTFDTSGPALARTLENGTFQPVPKPGQPDATNAYTMRVSPDTTARLVALHIMTKELRDWVWITLWWSPTPNSDFGADRPATLGGAFANYKMCVATAFDERDPAPGSHFADRPSLAAALDAAAGTAGDGPSTWCSNPYLEAHDNAARTNCIGCHQHGGTGLNEDLILSDEKRFPATSRKRVRATLPADYAFTLDGGIDLTSEMRSRVDALTPIDI